MAVVTSLLILLAVAVSGLHIPSEFSEAHTQHLHTSFFPQGWEHKDSGARHEHVADFLLSTRWLEADPLLKRLMGCHQDAFEAIPSQKRMGLSKTLSLKVSSTLFAESDPGATAFVARMRLSFLGLSVEGFERVLGFRNHQELGLQLSTVEGVGLHDDFTSSAHTKRHAAAECHAVVEAVRSGFSSRMAEQTSKADDGVSTWSVQSTSTLFPHKPAAALATALGKDHQWADWADSLVASHAPVWWIHEGSRIIPAWKIRYGPHPAQMVDLWVSSGSSLADKAEVLHWKQSATFATGTVYADMPPLGGSLSVGTINATLPDMLSGNLSGKALQGKFFKMGNCCPRITCDGGGTACSTSLQRCAQATDPSQDIFFQSQTFSIPKTEFSDNATGIQAQYSGSSVFFSGVQCSGYGYAIGNPDGNFFYTPVDGSSDAAAEDRFVEVQAYYALSRFFAHIRTVLQNGTFCLDPPTMQCNASGDPVMSGSTPANPFHIFTNMRFPPNYGDLASAPPSSTAGQTSSTPLQWNVTGLRRFANAFFISPFSVSNTYVNTLYIKQTQSLLGFFQSETKDFGYDSSVVYHEFGHALRHHFIPNMDNYGMDSYGQQANPGALDEGWADYLSASFRGVPLVGEYTHSTSATGALRALNNSLRCPSHFDNQVHSDSQLWSAALWQIRKSVGASSVNAFDRLVIRAMALADVNESMEQQATRVLAELNASSLGATVYSAAVAAFSDHTIKPACVRVIDVPTDGSSHSSTINLVSADSLRGVTTFAPYPVQLRVSVPANTKSFTLSWRQADRHGGGAFGGFFLSSVPPNVNTVQAVVSAGCPITWSSTGAQPTATGCSAPGQSGQVVSSTLLSSTSPQSFTGSVFDVSVEVPTIESPTSVLYYISPVVTYSLGKGYQGQMGFPKATLKSSDSSNFFEDNTVLVGVGGAVVVLVIVAVAFVLCRQRRGPSGSGGAPVALDTSPSYGQQ